MLRTENLGWASTVALQLTLKCMVNNSSIPLCRLSSSNNFIYYANNCTNLYFLSELMIIALPHFKR